MPPNVQDATLTNAALTMPVSEAQNVICQAYRNAYEKYCKAKHPRGYFNDKFYKELRAIKPKGAEIAKNTMREVPVIVTKAAKGADAAAKSAEHVFALAKSGNPAAKALAAGYQTGAQAITGGRAAVVTGMVAGVVKSSFALFRAFGAMKGPRNFFRSLSAMAKYGRRVRFLDGLVGNPGRSLEIKGPFDKERPAQFADNKQFDKDKGQRGFSADQVTCYQKKGLKPPECKK